MNIVQNSITKYLLVSDVFYLENDCIRLYYYKLCKELNYF